MSDFEAFDRHAASYGEAVDAAIRASGENTEFFARLKVHLVLVPGAPLFIFEHNPYNPLTVRVVRRIPFDEGVKLLRPYGAAELLRAAQFRVGRPRFYFFFPRILRCLRPIEAYLDWMPLG